uniref:DNA 5'-3' helicase n=1 Tax=Dasya naccarioides TaxID=2007180 RepID=A0A1Z1MH98_9FLOR|nr:Replication helicase subunit [Dasya naccarioides]ARW65259.1 Replication helicase subunit [Dasya naccarioides]
MKNLYHEKYLILPQNYLAEEILLGTIFIYPEIFYQIISSIKEEYFFLESHKLIYTYLLIINKKSKFNITEYIYTLGNTNILYKVGGIQKILDLMKQSQIFIISFYNITTYIQELVEIIQYNYIKRLMIQYGNDIIKLAYIAKLSNHYLYNKASSYLNITETKIPRINTKTFKKLITEFLLKTKYTHSTKFINKTKINNNKFHKSGFLQLDKLIFGLFEGDLIVIAGRPSMGKTSLAINIANNIVYNQKSAICIFSLEMSSQQIINKFISINSNLALKKLILKNIYTKDWNKIIKICYKLINKKIYINDKANVSIDYIEYTSKLLKKENKILKLIIIDYLQLIQTNFSSTINRTQELSYITRKLKLLAQYLHTSIVILSQLNRSIENRHNKTPVLSDLKDSGCLNISNNINIINNEYNKVSIKSLIQKSYKVVKINKFKNKNNKTEYKNEYIFILIEYLFESRIKENYFISNTYNHKYLFNYIWTKNYLVCENLPIITSHEKYWRKYKLAKYYIKKIKFKQYSKCYDLNIQDYFNFISKQIIVHNSIEQDADIVLILYQRELNKNNKDLINITLCKNRNGPIGALKLLFYPETTKFTNSDIDLLNE